MTRIQALIVSFLMGLVALVFITLFALILFLPVEIVETIVPVIIVTPTRTVTPTPTDGPVPTQPLLLPTAQPTILTNLSPTPTNTRVPTSTPQPERTATPTKFLALPTAVIPPSATFTRPIPTPQQVRSTATLVAVPTAFQPTTYAVVFDVVDDTITDGECTELTWRVEGASSVLLDGELVPSSGDEEVCPKKDTSYNLTAQIANGVSEFRQVTVTVNREQFDEDDLDELITPSDDD